MTAGMRNGTPPWQRRVALWRALVPLAVSALAFGMGVLVLATFLRSVDQPRGAPSATASRPDPEPVSNAPAVEITRVHNALHRIGAQCREAPVAGRQARIDRAVEEVLSFVRRYPEGRFPIDDETGTPLSLLLVVRDELRGCAPDSAARVNRALPPRFRDN